MASSITTAELGIRRSFGWVMAGNVTFAGSQWLLLVVLARLGTTAQLGEFAIATAVVGPAFVLAGMSLRTLLVTDVQREFADKVYIGFRLLTSLMLTLLAIAGALMAGISNPIVRLVPALSVWRASESLSDILHGWLQKKERIDVSGKLMAIRSVLCVGVLTFGLWSGFSLATCCYLAAGSAAAFVVIDIVCVRVICGWVIGPALFSGGLREIGRRAMPLAFAVGLVALQANAPRYALATVCGEQEAGVFAALSALAIAANMLVVSLGQACATPMAQNLAIGHVDVYLRLALRLFLLAGLLGLVGIVGALLAGEHVLTAIYGQSFRGQKSALVACMVAGAFAFVGSATGYALASARWFAVQVPILAIATAVTFFGSIWLGQRSGASGAAMAQLAGSVVQVVLAATCLAIGLRRRVEGELRVAS